MGILDRAVSRAVNRAVDKTVDRAISNAVEQKVAPHINQAANQTAGALVKAGTQQAASLGSFCTNCGRQNNAGAKFCGGCGAKLPTAIAE